MKIFNGKKEAEKILLDLRKKIKKRDKKPRLAIIIIGDNSASMLYASLKKEAGRKIGAEVFEKKFSKDVLEKEIIEKIESFNQDKSIDGIIVQLPLPNKFKTDRIIEAISPKKDVDGFHRINRELLKEGKPYFFPVLPLAIFTALKRMGAISEEKKILALVNSKIFGDVLSDFSKRQGLKINCILVSKLAKKGFLPISEKLIFESIKKADILITVFSRPNFIKGQMVGDGVILIDAGFIKRGKRAIGNVDKESMVKKASWISPSPGGIGPLVVALLLKNMAIASGIKSENYNF